MLSIYNDIRNEKYRRLIDYLCGECDCMSFHLPNVGHWFETPKNPQPFSYNYNHSDMDSDITDIDYIEYRERTAPWLAKLHDCILKNYKDIEYLGDIYSYRTHIYLFEINNSTANILKTADCLSDWKYPNMPEDLCFFSNGLCRFRTVAHENYYFMYLESSKDKRALKMMGIDYDDDPECKPRITMP